MPLCSPQLLCWQSSQYILDFLSLFEGLKWHILLLFVFFWDKTRMEWNRSLNRGFVVLCYSCNWSHLYNKHSTVDAFLTLQRSLKTIFGDLRVNRLVLQYWVIYTIVTTPTFEELFQLCFHRMTRDFSHCALYWAMWQIIFLGDRKQLLHLVESHTFHWKAFFLKGP